MKLLITSLNLEMHISNLLLCDNCWYLINSERKNYIKQLQTCACREKYFVIQEKFGDFCVKSVGSGLLTLQSLSGTEAISKPQNCHHATFVDMSDLKLQDKLFTCSCFLLLLSFQHKGTLT